ncbi:MAG: TonB-dependent receptor domain-containing protein [Glaciecola sp.]
MQFSNISKVALAVSLSLSANAFAETETKEDTVIDEITVVGKSVSFANASMSQEMKLQQSSMTSALAVIDNLPGVLVNEGDTFGADDWSTTVSIRGFQLSLDEQQIGITIDGIANGNSNYGGGAKANRYIDTENLGTVEVSQGTSDIRSRSNEALGGTLNFTTIDPTEEAGLTTSFSLGQFQSQKSFVRLNTGEIAPDTRAWVSVSSAQSSDWVDQTAENTRDHLAAKIISEQGDVKYTGYFSYDDTHEDNYQRISLAQFAENPDWDRLTAEWTGTPYVDQAYRKGWSTLRENIFGYLQAEYSTDNLEASANVYFHKNEGRGDWVPPYLVNVTDDGAGNPESEVVGNTTVMGGAALGQLFFVNRDGVALAPDADCQSSITFPYGGAGAQYDPLCYGQGAVPVGSYRHTHYQKSRFGFNADFAYFSKLGDVDNTLRGGVWYEDYEREEYRDWHKIIDSSSNYKFDHVAYWRQYDRKFPVQTTMLYLENEVDFGMVSARVGAKQFMVELEAQDNFTNTASGVVDSDSDLLLTAGVVAQTGIDGLEVFAGYAENFAAVKDTVLERDTSVFDNIEPETAENIDVGIRFVSDRITAAATFYDITFENRLVFIAPDSPDAIDYLIGTNGSYVNVGGIESSGFEMNATVYINDNWAVYGSYTNNKSEYAEGSLDFPAGNTVYGSAEDMFVLSIDWAQDNYFAGLSNKMVGDRWMDAANTQRIEGYMMSDLYAGVSVEAPFSGLQNMQVRLTINNLTDESYLGGVAGQSAWIGSPRTAVMNMSFTF